MRRVLGLTAVGLLAPVLQGTLAAFVPARFLPDLGFLFVVAIGLYWRSPAGGVLVAALLGFATDLLSGSLLGQHALLRIAAFGAARVFSRQLNLRGVLPQAIFVALLTAANALGIVALTAFFASDAGFAALLRGLPAQAVANALCVPFVARLTQRVLELLGDEESGRRLLRLEPRKWSA